jgi:gliding motility-associated-like protein
LGAIPICQNQYSQIHAYSGDGNYDNEVNPNNSCLDQEYYSVWYTFTAQTTGYFRFSIIPNDSNDDYDWAVYNLTNAHCSDIYNNPSICVSCNSYGNFNGPNGSTGASTANGGSGSWNGPGSSSGPPWNSDIYVSAGSTYALLICNWSQSGSGYSLNFNGSTATIFDNVAPSLSSITSANCGDTSIKIQFSEYVLCNTVQATDFKLIGAQGQIPITSIFGQSCSVGGTQERFFTIKTNQVFQSGNYKLILSGPVSDLCGNTSIPDTLDFDIQGLSFQTSSVPAICSPNGTATCIVVNGLAPYSYIWNTGQTSSSISGLIPSTYYVTAIDQRGCKDSTFVVVQSGSGSMSATLYKKDIDCYGEQSGIIGANLTSGIAPFNFSWSNGQHDSVLTHIVAGSYSVTISDHFGCQFTDSIRINQSTELKLFLDSTISETCSYSDGAAFTHVIGGIPPYQFSWSFPGAQNSSNLIGIHAGNYILTISDSLHCVKNINIDVQGQPFPTANFQISPPRTLLSKSTISFLYQSTNYSNIYWNFGDESTSTDDSPKHTYNSVDHFPVMLIVSSSNQCVDTLIQFVDIFEDFFIYIPNAFSPNGDGINDCFAPVIQGGSEANYSFEIYSRWGELVFKTNDLSKCWDGGFSQESYCMESVFVYQIIVNDLCGINHKYTGSFVLIK